MTVTGHAPERLPILPAASMEDAPGARVRRLFPTLELRHLDPFVVLDEFWVQSPGGFPLHPHRGFEAITYMLEGAVHHEDSLGNAGLVEAGGVQRCTAGRGIFHAEMPGGPGMNHGLQLWVHLPRRLEDVEPDYQRAHADDLPVTRADGVTVRTIVGEGSPIRVMTPMRYLDVTLEPGARHVDVIGGDQNGFVYALEGHVRLGDEILVAGHAALPGPGPIHIDAVDAARVLISTGQPHREPIVPRGPYVC